MPESIIRPGNGPQPRSQVGLRNRLIQCVARHGCSMNARLFHVLLLLTAAAYCIPSAALAQSAADSDRQETETESDRLEAVINLVVDQTHAEAFEDDLFPSAKKCAKCHPQHYREWSVSPHAYAQLSPVFLTMSNKLQAATSGTMGDFCIRCHTPVGIALGESTHGTNLDRHPTSREGVTCVVCHRINQNWGKGAGRQAIMAGNINQAVFGPRGSDILEEVLSSPDRFGVLKTSSDQDDRGRNIHGNAQRFFQMSTSAFCGACHDVFAPNGFRLEDAFSEFKNSPSATIDGHSCQDCHMGATPGKPEGYDEGPAAVVGNTPTRRRKITNHMMAGPDYSIVHRGLFPHHLTAIHEEGEPESDEGLATMREWLQFDDHGGWGTDQFEENTAGQTSFPAAWNDPIRRRKARRILNEQGDLLKEATRQRLLVLQAGYDVKDINVTRASRFGLDFQVPVANVTRGHGVPTGFDAERIVFLRTIVWNGNGRVVFMSGDLDPNGDVRDNHSIYVHNGTMPRDRQLFSLQSKFITRNVRGGEREQILPVPYSLDPLPFVRPETRPFTVLGRPMAARKQKQNIEPGGNRMADYHVSANHLSGPGPFTIRTQLIAGMVPPNLIHEIGDVGFDYGLSAKEVADRVVAGHLVIHEKSVRVDID